MSTVDGVEVTGPVGPQVLTRDEISQARGDAFAPCRWDDARALSTETALADEHEDLLAVPAHERMR